MRQSAEHVYLIIIIIINWYLAFIICIATDVNCVIENTSDPAGFITNTMDGMSPGTVHSDTVGKFYSELHDTFLMYRFYLPYL